MASIIVPSKLAPTKKSFFLPFIFVFSIFIAAAAAIVFLALDSFEAFPLPVELRWQPMVVPRSVSDMLKKAELIGIGKLLSPEDLTYDPHTKFIYTGCRDGWIKRVAVHGPDIRTLVVEDWVRVGGHPLGVSVGRNKELIVAHPSKGLLNISKDGKVQVLTEEADGVKFKLTNGVDVADDGIIYFTDASYKYELSEFTFDFYEGKPHGRLLSYDPTTKLTKVLAHNLYFANGVAVSPDQNYLVFCESLMRRCKKYYIRGKSAGSVDGFIENLSFVPDNIKSDGAGQFWIGYGSEMTPILNAMFNQPLLRKVMAVTERIFGRADFVKNGGALAVDTEGKPVARFSDPNAVISSVIRVGNHLYCGSIIHSHLISFNLTQDFPCSDV